MYSHLIHRQECCTTPVPCKLLGHIESLQLSSSGSPQCFQQEEMAKKDESNGNAQQASSVKPGAYVRAPMIARAC
eukprot:758198-Hanusia_phi.AAC.1